MYLKERGNMEKIIRIGTRDRMGIYCKIIYVNKALSITGVEGPYPSGNCKGACGQINPVSVDKFAKGWDQELLNEFNKIWGEWHLNDLKPGCEHQRAMGWEKESYNKHLSEPCPVCGYKFGTKWNKVSVPQSIIDFLFTLPDINKTPALV